MEWKLKDTSPKERLAYEALHSLGFMPRLDKEVSTDDKKKLYFSTTAGDAFSTESKNGKVSNRPNTCASYLNYHRKYKQGNCKFWDRSSLASSEYNEKPLDEVAVNRELRELMKPETIRTSHQFMDKTIYGDSFVDHKNPPRRKPVLQWTELSINPDDKLMALKSVSHEHHCAPPETSPRIIAGAPRDRFGATNLKFPFPSTYNSEHNQEVFDKRFPQNDVSPNHNDTGRVMGAILPVKVKAEKYRQRKNEERAQNAKSQPAFMQLDFKWLKDRPHVDPFDGEFDCALKEGRVDMISGLISPRFEQKYRQPSQINFGIKGEDDDDISNNFDHKNETNRPKFHQKQQQRPKSAQIPRKNKNNNKYNSSPGPKITNTDVMRNQLKELNMTFLGGEINHPNDVNSFSNRNRTIRGGSVSPNYDRHQLWVKNTNPFGSPGWRYPINNK